MNATPRDSLHGSRQSGKARCEKGWNWKPQPLTDYDLWYVVSGEGEVILNGSKYPAYAGCCFLFRPGDRIAAAQDDSRRLTVIFLHFNGIADELQGLPPCVQLTDTAWAETLLSRLLTLDDPQPGISAAAQALDDAEFAALLRAMLCMLARAASAEQDRPDRHLPVIRRTMRLIKEYAAAPPRHEELAAQAGLSPRYLNELFKRHTGLSLKTFIARARVERACHLLAESTLNVSQIADTLGYSDIYFFSKQFKQFTGESPLRYRSRALEPRSHHGALAPEGEDSSDTNSSGLLPVAPRKTRLK
ncbi:AraC-like ligand binding domain-containing protein [Paenibacillus sp. UNCCL117]|uniref:AraC family transcriptional regulator n=1 Tax=unclassified Paenibacillus TaxID=185978 RepID=UPI00088C5400|nr:MULTISPECIES: AraC family transcriptional regulator [unclassified Paenibacillus]SDC28179.1 AraC-like ligand binding domain-containing protein [Paenibacillus sp. cl123]SFW20495.1 AraC-like ligand binding domain-containing protein [Paenibacillus sp. UNCCL117]